MSNHHNTIAIYTIILAISLISILALKTSTDSATGAATFPGQSDSTSTAKFVFVQPETITAEDALTALQNAEGEIEEMEQFGLNTLFMKDTLLKAKRTFIGINTESIQQQIETVEARQTAAYLESLIIVFDTTPNYEIEKTNYTETMRLIQLITYRKNQAYMLVDAIDLVEEKEKQVKDDGKDTTIASQWVADAKVAFEEERYDEAQQLLSKANTQLDDAIASGRRARDIIEASKNFFVRYWWQSLIILVIIAAITPTTIKRVRKARARRKLHSLKTELETTTKLLKKAQEDCFIKKKITVDTYHIRANKYKERAAEIKRIIPVVHAIATETKLPKEKKPERIGILKIK